MKNLKKLFKQGVCHTMGLPNTLKSILRKRRIMETQIFHHVKNIIYKKSSKKKETQNPSRYYIILELISSFNTSPIIIFQKSYYYKPII